MRLLADENIPLETIRALRAAGHDVFSATETSPGATDEDLLLRANADERLLVTFDRDFGELVARQGRQAKAGVLFLRLVPRSAREVSDLVLELLDRDKIDWAYRLTIVDRVQVRQRRLG